MDKNVCNKTVERYVTQEGDIFLFPIVSNSIVFNRSIISHVNPISPGLFRGLITRGGGGTKNPLDNF